jgi:hypothetical protein
VFVVIENQSDRVQTKFYQLIEVITEVKIVHSNFVKKLKNTNYYELRVSAENETRIIMFAVDHLNFSECTKAICLYGFVKKSTKDYSKAIKQAENLLSNYSANNE